MSIKKNFRNKIESLRLDFYFVENKSVRLKIYVAFSVQLIQHKASLWDLSFNIDLKFLKLDILVCVRVASFWDSSFNIDLEFLKLKMLVCLYISIVC